MPFYLVNASPHGCCWVEADGPEHALDVVSKHYGLSVTPGLGYGTEPEVIKRNHPPDDACYLARDATWRMNDGAPMLSLKGRMLMAFGVPYAEAVKQDAEEFKRLNPWSAS